MSSKIEFFFDYVSVYSYLANSQLDQLTSRTGAEIVYRPMFLGGVMEATGNRPPATVKPKGSYLMSDIDRWCARYSLRFKMNPVFPQNTISALRVALVALHRGDFAVIHQALFDAMWINEENISKKETLAAVIDRAGLPAEEYVKEIVRQAIKDELKSNTEEAVQRGAFGAPTFYVGDQMFFGNDRFEFIEEAIASQAVM